MRRGQPSAAVVLVMAGQCGLVVLSSGCSDPGPGADAEVPDAPLGWDGSVEAEEVRVWDGESLAMSSRWRVSSQPEYSMVLDSVDLIIAGRTSRIPRFVTEGVFLSDGRVALIYSTGGSSQPDSLLLHFIDPASGEEVGIPAPRGEAGAFLDWVSFSMAAIGQGFVLVGDNTDYSGSVRPMKRTVQDVWFADRDGGFTRPPSYVDVDGGLLGTFADGSLVMWTRPVTVDTAIVTRIVAAQATQGLPHGAEGEPGEVLFTTANRRNPDRHEVRASWTSHPANVTVVAGDTIWVLPTGRPELVAVHRSGDVLLMVEWDAGDRSVPPGAPPDFWKGAERFPAAAELQLGADGLLYVERWTVLDHRGPMRGPEWLVFSQAGDLVARLDVPLGWRVLEFGHEEVLVVASENDGPDEVRIHAIERQPGR